MDAETYPKVKITEDGWVVSTSKGADLKGVYTNASSAHRALRKYSIQVDLAREAREEKKKNKKDK